MKNKRFYIVCMFIALSVLLAFMLIFDSKKISQEVLDLFPENDDRITIEAYRHFASSKYIPIFIEKQDEADEITQALSRMPYVTSVISDEIGKDARIYDFLAHNEAYLLTSESVADIFTPLLHTRTPIHPLQAPKDTKGLLIFAEIESLDDKVLKATLEDFKSLKQDYPSLHYFSADFMRVENLSLILKEVNLLLGFGAGVFLALYFLILRMPFLTLSTIASLVFSNMLAIVLVLWIYPKVTIMALSFGMGISNIALDYMLHHHFFGLYTLKKPRFNAAVFYGYFTTMIGFGVCLFIPFPLLEQLSLYAMISLSISYVLFAFVYPYIGFKPPRLFRAISTLNKPLLPSVLLLTLAFVGFIFAFNMLKIDFELSKLDYQNKPMLAEKALLNSIKDDKSSILISSKQAIGLMLFARALITEIDDIRFYTYQGDWEGQRSYYLASVPKVGADKVLTLLHLAQNGQSHLWSAEELAIIKASDIWLDMRPLEEIINGLANASPMPSLLILALLCMLAMLAINMPKAFIHTASFVLFPLSMALCAVASKGSLNIMHLFALLILVVISVDFGVYALKEGNNPKTTHAILFSALTTGIGFGVLTLSQTKALSSFGEVIFIGMGCMLILLIFGKRTYKH
ncbi:MMPL family transporter [Helicobacter marmotae]|nr:hypothetical protein [Helicobacter marmotae]